MMLIDGINDYHGEGWWILGRRFLKKIMLLVPILCNNYVYILISRNYHDPHNPLRTNISYFRASHHNFSSIY